MAQPQPQAQADLPQMPPAALSPPQHSPSPVNQPGLAMPSNRRPGLSPGPPSQAASPYPAPGHPASPYATSPGAGPATPTSVMSPSYTGVPTSAPPGPPTYSAAYTNSPANGPATPSLRLPEAQPAFTPTLSIPIAPATPHQQYASATMSPIPAPPTPGTMGPPSKPAEKPAKEYVYDATDSLAGTGIDIRVEEQALLDYYAGSFGGDSRTGLPANAPGGKSSFYGAGAANQEGQAATSQNQDELAAQAAEKAWSEAAHRLAVTRSNEMKDPFLVLSILHRRAEKIAKEHSIGLNLEIKNNTQTVGKLRAPLDFPEPKVTVSTKVGPDGALVATTGSWIPHDAYLLDQLALMSIATKHRIREKLEDGLNVATTRQKTSHGEVPGEWVEVAAPLNTADAGPTQDDSTRGVSQDNVMSPTKNSLKRPADGPADTSDARAGQPLSTNHLALAIRDVGKGDRGLEEARMRKRQKRLNPEAASSTPRAGSVAPGTPGSVAPEPESKPPTKKESKKVAAARLAEASSTATANQTLQHLMGVGRKKKGKQYAWMTAGSSGPSTPSRGITQPDAPGTPSAAPAPKAPEQTSLTADGRYRLGSWREDVGGARGIQLRDWVAALEFDGTDIKAIQGAYLRLDPMVK